MTTGCTVLEDAIRPLITSKQGSRGNTVNKKATEDFCRCIPLFSIVYISLIMKIHCSFPWDLAQANKQVSAL